MPRHSPRMHPWTLATFAPTGTHWTTPPLQPRRTGDMRKAHLPFQGLPAQLYLRRSHS
jgi:hypothetical protein